MGNMFNLMQGDCLEGIRKLQSEGVLVDTVITSPPYNISLSKGRAYALKCRGYDDTMDNIDYMDWILEVISETEKMLSDNGVFLLNINYGSNNNETLWLLLSRIINETNMTIADQIIWKPEVLLGNQRRWRRNIQQYGNFIKVKRAFFITNLNQRYFLMV